MQGAGPEADVWSLGATVVELVTGSPPYFDLPPLSAMFHIVADESVPLPGGVSPALHGERPARGAQAPAPRRAACSILTNCAIRLLSARAPPAAQTS